MIRTTAASTEKARSSNTFFWVCDFVIRQTDVKSDLEQLGDCVASCGHTVLLLEPWHKPEPLERAYCIKEVFHTQKANNRFDLVMGTAQQKSYVEALQNNFDLVSAAVSNVNVRHAQCRDKIETERILAEFASLPGGLAKCNEVVCSLLRRELGKQGKAALQRMPETDRATSALMLHLAVLQKEQGETAAARATYVEVIAGYTKNLGADHSRTLLAKRNLAMLQND